MLICEEKERRRNKAKYCQAVTVYTLHVVSSVKYMLYFELASNVYVHDLYLSLKIIEEMYLVQRIGFTTH